MHKEKVANGVWWVGIPEAGLSVLCGCPADSVKLLFKRGLISQVERDGKRYETGPNAILLSDVSLQGGEFANLAEFPVLQMLYRQGLIIPGHPRNDGTRPLLIGLEERLKAQSAYIMRGSYGLASIQELLDSGASPALAADVMRMKLRFAFGRMRETEELLDLRAAGALPVELRNGATIRRKSFNVYEFAHGSSTVVVDLNLQEGESYEAPFSLPPSRIGRGYFSVVHIGEGDGWDQEKPCMGSLVIFQGRIYLVDAGPHILDSLTALGIGANEIDGIFQTHAHDDHFAGLTSLVRADHRLRYYAAPMVRASVAKKLSALMGFGEASFERYFDAVDLALDAWNDVEGLEVRPILSAHPLETTVLVFRACGAEGPKLYAHLADIPTFEVLRSMVTEDPGAAGVSRAYQERLERELLARADIKKIDAGGGAIHGSALDFREDASPRILVSHVAGRLSDQQKQVGSSASFGQEDILIAGNEDYALEAAFRRLSSYFSTPAHNIRMLLNCPKVTFSAGSLILREGTLHAEIYLVVQGIVEVLGRANGIHGRVGAGSLIGEYSALHAQGATRTSRALSDVVALRIPTALYEEFLGRSGLAGEARRVAEIRQFLQDTWLFGDMISFPLLRGIAQGGKSAQLSDGESAALGEGVHLVREGRVELIAGDPSRDDSPGERVAELVKGSIFIGEKASAGSPFRALALGEATILSIPDEILRDIPIVQWKLLETLGKRMIGGDGR
jgi:hemerythrin